MPEIEIRPVEVEDFSALGNFEGSYQTTRVWQMERSLRDGELVTKFREMRLPRPALIAYPYSGETLISRAKGFDGILVGRVEDRIVGYVAFRKIQPSSTAWVSEMVVDEPMRNKSVATALLLAVQDWSVRLGLRRVCLEMQSKNYPGICLAGKLGYEFSGYLDQYYPNQDIALIFGTKA